MRDLTRDTPARIRDRSQDTLKIYGSAGDGTCGRFWIQSPIDGAPMLVVASSGDICGWDHVSVSRKNRCPNWPEMCHAKDLFFAEEETVIQYHPPKSEYVNLHPFCLHLWRPTGHEFPRPPKELVG